MITINEATVADVKIIQDIVNTTWPITYGAILSETQLDYMIDLIYSDQALQQLLSEKEQLFYIAYEGASVAGFIAIEHNYKQEAVTRLHKIYILPETQGKGVGKFIINFIENRAKDSGSKTISLNVNRFNEALHFYQKIGFRITGEENIDIGNGFLMEDYVMEKIF